MEPRIQYARTKDGVSIAFCVMGEGRPLVWLRTLPYNSFPLERRLPELRRNVDRVAARWKVIRHDVRGIGLSQSDVSGISLDTLLLDLESVVDRLGLARFAVWAG